MNEKYINNKSTKLQNYDVDPNILCSFWIVKDSLYTDTDIVNDWLINNETQTIEYVTRATFLLN